MSKIVDYTYLIYNNPFVLTSLLIEFYKDYEGQKNDVLLAYLILPLALHKETKVWLKKASIKSSIHTFRGKKENLIGLPKRVTDYKKLTNQCLQHAIDNEYIVINDDLKIVVTDKKPALDTSIRDSLKASANFVKVIRELDVVTIYKLIGVKKI